VASGRSGSSTSGTSLDVSSSGGSAGGSSDSAIASSSRPVAGKPNVSVPAEMHVAIPSCTASHWSTTIWALSRW
jgi:hypothetical protein